MQNSREHEGEGRQRAKKQGSHTYCREDGKKFRDFFRSRENSREFSPTRSYMCSAVKPPFNVRLSRNEASAVRCKTRPRLRNSGTRTKASAEMTKQLVTTVINNELQLKGIRIRVGIKSIKGENDGNTIVSRSDISLCVFDELIRKGSSDRLVRNFVETLRTGSE